MKPIKLVLDRTLEGLVMMVNRYGYNSDGTPLCNTSCQSELCHLIEDWLDNSTNLRDEQNKLGLKNVEFEQLIASIFLADTIEFTETKYYWKLKNKSAVRPYIMFSRSFDGKGLQWDTTTQISSLNPITESEQIELLSQCGGIFKIDDFERVEIND